MAFFARRRAFGLGFFFGGFFGGFLSFEFLVDLLLEDFFCFEFVVDFVFFLDAVAGVTFFEGAFEFLKGDFWL